MISPNASFPSCVIISDFPPNLLTVAATLHGAPPTCRLNCSTSFNFECVTCGMKSINASPMANRRLIINHPFNSYLVNFKYT